MTVLRTVPAETDRYAYDLDAIRSGVNLTLRRILIRAGEHGHDSGIHDDAEMAEKYAEICDGIRWAAQRPEPLVLTVAEARELYDAAMSTWHYADDNNYGDPAEDIEEDRIFGQHGKFMLHALTWPWEALTFADDGSHGFKRLES